MSSRRTQKGERQMTKGRWLVGGGAALLVLAGVSAVLLARSAANDASSGSAVANAMVASAGSTQEMPLVTLYKNPTCACCADWAEHMGASGFRVDVKEDANLAAVRDELGVPFRLGSCHTAVVHGYPIEGHVPADLVRTLLAERPEIAGLAVPGMPPGVPGMPDPGPGRAPYEILAFQADGSTHVFATR